MANIDHLRIAHEGAAAISEWRRTARGEKFDLSNAVLAGVDLRHADLRRAILTGGDLRETDLRNADVRRGTVESANLAGARLGQANLRYVNLRHANLRGANLSHAELGHATFESANLQQTNLDHAQLGHTKLGAANLAGANLSHAWLRRAGVIDANFDQARFEGTILIAIDLSKAQGLNNVRAAGPSSIDLDTILKSKAGISDSFLRSCGYDPRIQTVLVGTDQERARAVREWGLEGNPLRLQSCFVSYSTCDQDFVDRLQRALNSSGADAWYAPEHGRWGERITEQIDREISRRERVILVCSQSSLSDSRWVQWELDKALAKQDREKKTVIFPIMIDDALIHWDHPNGTALRQILAGDFRGATADEPFREAMARLLEGLRSG